MGKKPLLRPRMPEDKNKDFQTGPWSSNPCCHGCTSSLSLLMNTCEATVNSSTALVGGKKKKKNLSRHLNSFHFSNRVHFYSVSLTSSSLLRLTVRHGSPRHTWNREEQCIFRVCLSMHYPVQDSNSFRVIVIYFLYGFSLHVLVSKR